ncbi:hypothetical protein [Anderseniella sp. Alg231-50]|uniref:hypothetical protein n=1 Tax=Anderseniella sp. Alg231-50 TaxID=1922226 RepID=UPI000D550911
MVNNQVSKNSTKPDDDDDLPVGDSPGFIFLKIAVYTMGLMIVAGFAFLIYTLVNRASTLPPPMVSAEEAIELAVGPGETVQSVSLNRGSLAIHVRRPDGSEAIIVYSLARQGIVQRLNIKPQ